ncbi:hypothetical protein [Ensifer adhaerens]|uniref:hypothetical protein n=1 Tax=Ensifer adhaerens TaxID=106592 RepID=UPI001F31D314|nr:hypothetical protein [Ensifer adhaerens]
MERVDEHCALCNADARIAQALAKAGQQVRFSQSAKTLVQEPIIDLGNVTVLHGAFLLFEAFLARA